MSLNYHICDIETPSLQFFRLLHCDWLLLQAANVVKLAHYVVTYMPKTHSLYLKLFGSQEWIMVVQWW